MGVGEFLDAFFHEGFFQVLDVDLGGDFFEDGRRGKAIDLAGEGATAGLNGGVGGGGVGLDVAACEGLDVFPGGIVGVFDAGAGEDHFLGQGGGVSGPEALVLGPDLFGVDYADLSLGRGGEGGDVFFRVLVDAGNEDAVDAFEAGEGGAALGAAPDGVSGGLVLAGGEDEGDVEDDAGGAEIFEGGEAGGGGGDFDHAVFVAGGPLFAEGDVARDAVGKGGAGLGIFEQGIEFEADVAVVA